jgi:hypothetical protein
MASTSDFAAPSKRDNNRLSARIVSCNKLDAATVQAMFDLYASNYADVSDQLFRRDLEQKTDVLLLTNADNQLCGFTTLEIYSSKAAGRSVRVLFSGDTVIDPAYWGSPGWALEWIRFAGTVARRHDTPLYWLLIVKGHRTYRFLPAFAKHYIPHHKIPESADERAMLSALAREKFGDNFDSDSGVIHFPTPQGRLVDELADVPTKHRKLGPVAHFLNLNPGYRDGDELVCLCRLGLDNLRPLAARAFAADAGQAN